MPTITVFDIKSRSHLNNAQFAYVIENLGKPMPLYELSWFRDGELCSIAVYYKDSVIVLFPTTQGILYEVNL